MSRADGLYIGLMSGTSADGIDAALVNFNGTSFELIYTLAVAFDTKQQSTIKQLIASGSTSLEALGQLSQQLAASYAAAVSSLLYASQTKASDIIAIACHGQTIRHLPPNKDYSNNAFSMQIGDPSALAATTAIDVIADFRQADIAQGGHGAPLAPGFHDFAFKCHAPCGVLNLGGIANITILGQPETLAWDTGPASNLMDNWIFKNKGLAYDDEGQWAASGQVQEELVNTLLDHPYFQKKSPKSTGFETFNLQWLDQCLKTFNYNFSPADIQASLLELTAKSIAQSLVGFSLKNIFVCGGGAYNTQLLKRLRTLLPETSIKSTEAVGIAPDWVEAVAFAWLGWRNKNQEPGNIPSVTGAKQAVVLGGLYTAPR